MGWKEEKNARDFESNKKAKRYFRVRTEKPGMMIETVNGVQYFIAKDGSRRRLK